MQSSPKTFGKAWNFCSSSTPEDVDFLTSTECYDGSFVFWFGNASEIREKIGEEIESSSIVVVAIVDDNPQLLVNEKQSVVLDNDPETPLVNDSRKIDRHLELDSVEDGEHGILSEDVADECNGTKRV
ncbi:hypothetical protein SESBI_01895 [Sesbania bispinosa]|nr:hypothetical protein SESBI_01895 [Sesbania bispinosa]